MFLFVLPDNEDGVDIDEISTVHPYVGQIKTGQTTTEAAIHPVKKDN